MNIQLVLSLVTIDNWYANSKSTAESFISSKFNRSSLSDSTFKLDLFNYINCSVLVGEHDNISQEDFDTLLTKINSCITEKDLADFAYSMNVIDGTGKQVLLVCINPTVVPSINFNELVWEKK